MQKHFIKKIDQKEKYTSNLYKKNNLEGIYLCIAYQTPVKQI